VPAFFTSLVIPKYLPKLASHLSRQYLGANIVACRPRPSIHRLNSAVLPNPKVTTTVLDNLLARVPLYLADIGCRPDDELGSVSFTSTKLPDMCDRIGRTAGRFFRLFLLDTKVAAKLSNPELFHIKLI